MTDQVVELTEAQIEEVAGGVIGTTLFWLGVAQTAEWVAEKAYAAGKWVGQNS